MEVVFFAFVCKRTAFRHRFRQDIMSDFAGVIDCTYM